jgi:hypothetical protein
MAKIHSHYDNLKVARKAPQEVIRAAYKALSQKYHPDKNPGDEKAARIMAIVNSAYGTLADPVRRREHDEWIAAEEWEIEWLESTRAEDSRDLVRQDNWEGEVGSPPAYRRARDPVWWIAMCLCLLTGALAAMVGIGDARTLPAPLAALLGKTAAPAAALPAVAAPPLAAPAAPKPDPELDGWARPAADLVDPAQRPQVHTLAVTQLVIPSRRPDCRSSLNALVAPNGEPWPDASGYLSGFAVDNEGSGMEISVDNGDNGSPVLVKVFDLERRTNVRHVYVKANEQLTVDKLAPGRYAVRYQNIESGASGADCLALRNAATAPPDTAAEAAPAR